MAINEMTKSPAPKRTRSTLQAILCSAALVAQGLCKPQGGLVRDASGTGTSSTGAMPRKPHLHPHSGSSQTPGPRTQPDRTEAEPGPGPISPSQACSVRKKGALGRQREQLGSLAAVESEGVGRSCAGPWGWVLGGQGGTCVGDKEKHCVLISKSPRRLQNLTPWPHWCCFNSRKSFF